MTKILVATGNKGKLAEYRDLLQELNLEWLSLKDVGLANMEVDETGDTFEENARIKAQAYGDAAGLLTIADDSGLEIEVLGGAPGIYSARYGAPEVTTDVGRYQKVLREMEGVTERSARFVCVVAIFEPGHGVKLARGDWHGQIGEGPRGANGFGYDPIFITSDGRTSAELPPEEKNVLSHRGRAVTAAKPILEAAIERLCP